MKIESAKVHSLRRSTTQEEMDKQLREVSKSYEKHFLREMVKAMRSSVHESELVPKSMAERIYAEKLDDQYVETWGDVGGIGLAEMIYQDIQSKIFGAAPPPGSELPKVHMPMPLKSDEAPVLKLREDGFDLETGEPSASTDVEAPLAGVVEEVLQSQGRQFVRLNHGSRGISLISFAGEVLPFERGTKVQTAQRLGQVDEALRPLHWKWTRVKG